METRATRDKKQLLTLLNLSSGILKLQEIGSTAGKSICWLAHGAPLLEGQAPQAIPFGNLHFELDINPVVGRVIPSAHIAMGGRERAVNVEWTTAEPIAKIDHQHMQVLREGSHGHRMPARNVAVTALGGVRCIEMCLNLGVGRRKIDKAIVGHSQIDKEFVGAVEKAVLYSRVPYKVIEFVLAIKMRVGGL